MSKVIIFLLSIIVPINVFAECKANIPGHDPSRYETNNDGTVRDLVTNLMWMRCDLGAKWDKDSKICVTDQNIKKFKGDWVSALQATADLNATGGFASYTDWRVPNIKEIMSLVMLNCFPTIDSVAFPDAEATYWTSTPSKHSVHYSKIEYKVVLADRYETGAWVSHLQGADYGKSVITGMSDPNYVRLVRYAGSVSGGTP